MKNVLLKVKGREATGSSKSKHLRASGLIPAVVYGAQGTEVISVDNHSLADILKHHRTAGSVVLTLEFDAGLPSRSAIIQEMQRHPLTFEILNVDFKEISLKENLVSKVPVVTKGDSPGVQVGGVLEQHLWEIKVSCLPMDIPEEFRIDISTLDVGDFLHVRDLPLSGKVRIEENPKEMVLAIIAPRKENEDETSEEAPKELEVTSERKSDEKGS